MIEVTRDHKSNNVCIITKTDAEGFHQQLAVTFDELLELDSNIKRIKEKILF